MINIFEIYVDEDELEQIMNTVDYINAKDDKDYTAMDLYSYEFKYMDIEK